jgi:hypothetical protein
MNSTDTSTLAAATDLAAEIGKHRRFTNSSNDTSTIDRCICDTDSTIPCPVHTPTNTGPMMINLPNRQTRRKRHKIGGFKPKRTKR